MPPSRELLAVLSAETRFQPDALEKVLRLIELLKEIDGHPLLGPKLVLKGGTALNLFHLDLPRISVDLDFNYTGRLEREMMLEERPKVERATELVAASLGYPAQRTGIEDAHAGTRWVLTYTETGGSTDHLEVSINWIHRVPILNSERRRVRQIHPAFSTEATLLALEELYAGKVAALLDRAQPRDLFDVAQLVSQQARLDQRALREVSLFYLGMGLEDPRRLGLAHVLELSDRAIRLRLSPLMRRDEQPSRETLLKVVPSRGFVAPLRTRTGVLRCHRPRRTLSGSNIHTGRCARTGCTLSGNAVETSQCSRTSSWTASAYRQAARKTAASERVN
ncbi:MAG: nucleotidyl transferase AbiEii/AbiGii toxin family protein [bacterium]